MCVIFQTQSGNQKAEEKKKTGEEAERVGNSREIFSSQGGLEILAINESPRWLHFDSNKETEIWSLHVNSTRVNLLCQFLPI